MQEEVLQDSINKAFSNTFFFNARSNHARFTQDSISNSLQNIFAPDRYGGGGIAK